MRGLVAVLLVALASSVAWGQANAESTRLFEEGRTLAKDGKYEEACAKFDQSLELDRASGTLVNLADCHEHLGHLALAWRLFDEAARESEKSGNAERAKFARDRAQALVPKTGTIIVRLAQPNVSGLTVTIAGRNATPAAEVREIVDPGDVTIEVRAPNAPPFTKTERAEAGLKSVIDVPAFGESSGGGGGRVTGRYKRRRSRVLTAYALAGGGLLTLVGSTALAYSAKARHDEEFKNGNCNENTGECNDDGFANQNSAITQAHIATFVGVAGLGLIVGGAVVWVTAPRDLVVIPTATADAAGLAVVGRF